MRSGCGCTIGRKLAEEFALAARLYAESAVRLAFVGKSGIEYSSLRDQTIEAQGRSEAAFRAFNEHVSSHQYQCGEITRNGHGHLDAQPSAVSAPVA